MVDNVKVAALSMVDNGGGEHCQWLTTSRSRRCQWLTTGEGSIVNG